VKCSSTSIEVVGQQQKQQQQQQQQQRRLTFGSFGACVGAPNAIHLRTQARQSKTTLDSTQLIKFFKKLTNSIKKSSDATRRRRFVVARFGFG
jgi:uncharacterized protein YegL